MIAAAISDVRSRTISNELNAGMALLAIPFWIASGLAPWPDVATQFGAAFLVFLLFAGLFAVGAMGGGDVKMIGWVRLRVPPQRYSQKLMTTAYGGGILWARLVVSM